jgi:hypothetical protein
MTDATKKRKKNNARLMPVDKDGKEVDWFRGWDGIADLAKAYGKTWSDVGLLMEETWGDKTTIEQVVACSYIYLGLAHIKNKDKEILSKRQTKENDTHLAIRVNLKNIKRFYNPKTKDFYKSVRQMYDDVMNNRGRENFVKDAGPYWASQFNSSNKKS